MIYGEKWIKCVSRKASINKTKECECMKNTAVETRKRHTLSKVGLFNFVREYALNVSPFSIHKPMPSFIDQELLYYLPGHWQVLQWSNTKQYKWSCQDQGRTKFCSCEMRGWTLWWHSKLQKCMSKSSCPNCRLCSICYCIYKYTQKKKIKTN